MKELSKDELINLYETLPEDTLRKLGIYSKAKEVYEEKQKLERLKKERIDRAIVLVKEAQELLSIYRLSLKISSAGHIKIVNEDGVDTQKKTRQHIGRAKKGLKTPQSEYRMPILEVLTEMDGRGAAGEVLEGVYEKMKDVLKPTDLEKVPSGADIRWRNTTNWARNAMVNDGLLSKDSPIGIWEITEKGKNYLKEHLNE